MLKLFDLFKCQLNTKVMLSQSDSVSHDASGEEEMADRDREQEASAGGRQKSTATPEGETQRQTDCHGDASSWVISTSSVTSSFSWGISLSQTVLSQSGTRPLLVFSVDGGRPRGPTVQR